MSKILVINGNPKQDSLCKSLAEAYTQGVKQGGVDVTVVHVSELNFDINLTWGYEKNQTLEEDLSDLQATIIKSSHIVVISPVWWGTIPAKLKGLFDRVLLPGFAFQFKEGKSLPEKLLKGKTSRIIVTMDSPIWYFKLILGDPIVKTLKKPILEFCGIKVKNISRLGSVVASTVTIRKKWIESMKKAGLDDSVEKTNSNNCSKH